MRKWEDIVKDKLEGYESPLPEGSLAEFRARREGAAPAAKRYAPRWGWVLAGAAAVAAGLAALLLPPRPAVPEDAIQVIKDQPVAEVVLPDTTEVSEPIPVWMPLVQPATRKSVWNAPVARQEAEITAAEPEVPAVVPAEEPAAPEAEEAPEAAEEAKPAPGEPRWTDAPFVPQTPAARPVRLNVAPVAGAVVGGGLLAAVLTPGAKGSNPISTDKMQANAAEMNLSGNAANGVAYYNYNNEGPLSNDTSDDLPQDVLSGDYTHYRPLKAGLSARIPLSEKLNLTSGLTYSLYRSKFTYSLSGEKVQSAHYLGVPVRLDWTFASSRWLDVYVGAGVAGDFCLGSTLGGKAFQKDGPSLSVLGAGGLQWNILPRLGLYLEPELSWNVLGDGQALMTYRQEHPLVFTVATGLRINLGKQ